MGILASIDRALDGVKRSAPSYFGSASTMLAGPLSLDAFGAKRGPTGPELVEAYKSLIFACVQLNALGVARTPLKLYCDATKGGKPSPAAGPRSLRRSARERLVRSGFVSSDLADDVDEITDHPLLDMLDSPDSEGYFSRFDFIALMSSYCDVVGVAYAKLDPGGSGRPPQHCWPLQAQYVYDVRRPGTPIVERYTYFGDTYDPKDVLRFRVTMGLRDPYGRGYSPTYAALQYAQLEDKFVAIQDQLLGKGPRPDLMVSAKDATMPMGDAERQRYVQDLTRLHAGGMAGRVLVTTGAVDVKPLTYAPTDLSGLTLADSNMHRICNVFGIPISFFSTETNLANLQAADTQHGRYAVEPRCRAIAGTLTRLAQRYDPRLFFAFDDPVEEDRERDARVNAMYLVDGQRTINEIRADDGLDDVEWGDEPWLSTRTAQPAMIKEQHDSAMETAKAGVENAQNATANADVPASAALAAKSDPGGDNKSRAAVHAGPVARLSHVIQNLGLHERFVAGEITPEDERRVIETIRLGDAAGHTPMDWPDDEIRGRLQARRDERFDAVLTALERSVGI